MSMLIRKIDKIKNYLASCTLWNLGENKRKEDAPLFFVDGLISFNSEESILIGCNQDSYYALNISQNEELREKYAIKDKDVFLGRDGNYLLFRDGNLTIETGNININASKITFNGIDITMNTNILSVNGKQIAVVGGDINPTTNKIITSGQ